MESLSFEDLPNFDKGSSKMLLTHCPSYLESLFSLLSISVIWSHLNVLNSNSPHPYTLLKGKIIIFYCLLPEPMDVMYKHCSSMLPPLDSLVRSGQLGESTSLLTTMSYASLDHETQNRIACSTMLFAMMLNITIQPKIKEEFPGNVFIPTSAYKSYKYTDLHKRTFPKFPMTQRSYVSSSSHSTIFTTLGHLNYISSSNFHQEKLGLFSWAQLNGSNA